MKYEEMQELFERKQKLLKEMEELSKIFATTCDRRHRCYYFINKRFKECVTCDKYTKTV